MQDGPITMLEPGLRLVLAPNPAAMTGRGTNTYLLGQGRVAVIDPGPALPAHLSAILSALEPGETVSHIFVTHSHLDHSPLARPLAEATGAPILAFGDSRAGLSPRMAARAAQGLAGGEGVDAGFAPDIKFADGQTVDGEGWGLRALHTPGHMGNHLCLVWGDRVFSGDHVMGWASSLISPPDGDMGAYMASLDRLDRERATRLYPGHGHPVADPAARIAGLAAHRRDREAQVLAALALGPADAHALAQRIYTDTPATLLPAAARNVLAHLIDLEERKILQAEGLPGPATKFALA